jgi:hypothetical protein
MPLLVCCPQPPSRNCKAFDHKPVGVPWREAFPGLVSAHRWVAWMPSALLPRCLSLQHGVGSCTGIRWLASSRLQVGHHRRMRCHPVLRGRAARGKTSVAGFLDCKLHRVVKEPGECIADRWHRVLGPPQTQQEKLSDAAH